MPNDTEDSFSDDSFFDKDNLTSFVRVDPSRFNVLPAETSPRREDTPVSIDPSQREVSPVEMPSDEKEIPAAPLENTTPQNIQKALKFYLVDTLPNVVLPLDTTEMHLDYLADFLEKNKHDKNFKINTLLSCGLIEATACAFLLGETYFNDKSLIVSVENNTITQVFYNPVMCFSDFFTRISAERFSKKNIKFYPEMIDGLGEIVWPNADRADYLYTLFYVNTKKNPSGLVRDYKLFNEKSLPVFLKILLTPSVVFQHYLAQSNIPADEARDIVVYFDRQREKFLEAFLKSSRIPKKILWRAVVSELNRYREAFQENIDAQEAKIIFLFSSVQMKMITAKLHSLKDVYEKRKEAKLPIAYGIDLYSVLVGCHHYCKEMDCLKNEKSESVSYTQRLLQLQSKLQQLCRVLMFLQINESDGFNEAIAELNNIKDNLILRQPDANLKNSLSEFDDCKIDHDYFNDTSREVYALFIAWLFENEEGIFRNVGLILAVAKNIYGTHFKNEQKLPAQALSILSNSFGRLSSSLFGGKVTPESAPILTEDDLASFELSLSAARDEGALDKAFATFFAIQGGAIELVHKEFLTALFAEFDRQLSVTKKLLPMKNISEKQIEALKRYRCFSGDQIQLVVSEFMHEMRGTVSVDATGLVSVKSSRNFTPNSPNRR